MGRGAGTGAKGNTGEKEDEEVVLVAGDDDEVGAIRRVKVRDARNGQSVEGGRRGGQARLTRGQEAQEQGLRIQRAQGNAEQRTRGGKAQEGRRANLGSSDSSAQEVDFGVGGVGQIEELTVVDEEEVQA